MGEFGSDWVQLGEMEGRVRREVGGEEGRIWREIWIWMREVVI